MAARGSFSMKNDNLPVDHHGDYKVDHNVFILGKNIAKYTDMWKIG